MCWPPCTRFCCKWLAKSCPRSRAKLWPQWWWKMLIPLADRLGQAPVILRVNPAAQQALLSAIEANTSLPIQITPDPTLGEGQVHLQLGTAEAELDLDKATADIAAAVRGFFDLFVKDHLHG